MKFRGSNLTVLSTLNLGSRFVDRIKKTAPAAKVFYSTDEQEIQNLIEGAQVVLGYRISREAFRNAKNLKWIHTPAAGADPLLFPEIVKSAVTVTCSRGIYGVPLAEHAFALILSFTRNLVQFGKDQSKCDWSGHVEITEDMEAYPRRCRVDELKGKTIGIVGLGNSGKEVAKRGKCFGMKVIAIESKRIKCPNYVDRLLAPNQLRYLLQNSDFVVICVPLTNATRNIIGEEELKIMKNTSYLINIARGPVVKENSLIKALKEGWIKGTGLDVFDQEPLSPESELYSLRNVIITPHMGGATPYLPDRVVESFCRNLTRFIRGKSLINVVHKSSLGKESGKLEK